MVAVLPISRRSSRCPLQHRGSSRCRRHGAREASKNHIPNLDKFWEKFYFRPGNLGYPVFQTAVGPIGHTSATTVTFFEGWREPGLNGAQIVFNPNATKPGLSNRLWEIEQPAAAVANGYFVAAPNGSAEDNSRERRHLHGSASSAIRRATWSVRWEAISRRRSWSATSTWT